VRKVVFEIELEVAQALLPLLTKAAEEFTVGLRMYRRNGRLLRQVAFDLGKAILLQYPDVCAQEVTK